jgi:hypothetical protein
MASKFRILRYSISLFLLLLSCFELQAQSIIGGEERQRALKDSLGIVIPAHQFDSLVGFLLIKFKDSSEKKIEDYILLVKVGNTIAFDQLFDSCRECNELYNLYLFKYMKTIAKVTDATISIGLSYYSKKYDLQIGGVRTKNNYFRIVH